MGEPLRVFVSYAREDKKLKDKLLEQLSVLERFRGVAVWTDDEIKPGEKWRPAIEKAMATTDVALLLVSPSSLASGFINDTEIPAMLKRNASDGMAVIPVILRDCHWKEHPAIEPFNVLPKGAIPIAQHTGNRRDKAFKEVAGAIAKLAKKRAEATGAVDKGTAAHTAPSHPVAAEATARAATASALHQLRSPPADFTGREAELADLRARLGSGGAIIAGLTGQGGVGKTALALKLAADLARDYPDAQIDIDLRGASKTPLSAIAVMERVVRAFDPEEKLPESEAEAAARYRSVLHGKRVLILLDDARDEAQIAPLLPPAGCLLIVTSRQRFAVEGLDLYDLDQMSPGDAIALVVRIAPRLGTEVAAEITKLCGYLPFALRMAASTLKVRRDLKPATYLEQLRTPGARAKLLEKVISLSLEQLEEPVRALWLPLGVMPADFDRAAAVAVVGVEAAAAEEHLGELVRRSLLDWDAASERYRMHDLARDYARAQLSAQERYAAERRHTVYFAAVAGAAHHTYLKGGAGVIEGLRAFDREWPHIAAAQAWAGAHAESDNAATTICCSLPLMGSSLLSLRQHPREQIVWLEHALAAARRLGSRADEGMVVCNLGNAYRRLGEDEKAIGFFEQYLAIADEIGDRRGQSHALGNLGIAYRNLGETQKAIEFYERVLTTSRELGDRTSEGLSLGNLGVAYRNLGETQKAIEFYERQLVIAREIGNRRTEGMTLGNLGNAFKDLGETQKAIAFHEQSMAIARELGDRAGEARASWNLGVVYEAFGDLRRAVDLMQVKVEFYREIGHRDLEKFETHLAATRARLRE
jgi:tetratricopeptide (TPR) repeat protein